MASLCRTRPFLFSFIFHVVKRPQRASQGLRRPRWQKKNIHSVGRNRGKYYYFLIMGAPRSFSHFYSQFTPEVRVLNSPLCGSRQKSPYTEVVMRRNVWYVCVCVCVRERERPRAREKSEHVKSQRKLSPKLLQQCCMSRPDWPSNCGLFCSREAGLLCGSHEQPNK